MDIVWSAVGGIQSAIVTAGTIGKILVRAVGFRRAALLVALGVAYRALCYALWGPLRGLDSAQEREKKPGLRPYFPLLVPSPKPKDGEAVSVAVGPLDVEPPEHQRAYKVERGHHPLPRGRGRIWYQLVRPLSYDRVTGMVVFVHRLERHCDFELFQVARYCAEQQGLACLLFDQPGHGKSDGAFGHIGRWSEHVETIEAFVDSFVMGTFRWVEHRAQRRLRLFALGDSSGGTVLGSLCLRRPTLFDGAILLAPVLAAPPLSFAQSVLASIVPSLPAGPPWCVPETACGDSEQCAALRHDPLRYAARSRLGTVQALQVGANELQSVREFETPLLVLHGAEDRSPLTSGSERFVNNAPARDKRFEVVEGGHHHLLLGGRAVMALIFKWLSDRSA